jgi:hypothetical protein
MNYNLEQTRANFRPTSANGPIHARDLERMVAIRPGIIGQAGLVYTGKIIGNDKNLGVTCVQENIMAASYQLLITLYYYTIKILRHALCSINSLSSSLFHKLLAMSLMTYPNHIIIRQHAICAQQ